MGPEFILAIIAMAMGAGVIKAWIRARHGEPVDGPRRHRNKRQDSREVEGLRSENARLVDRLEMSEDRLAVLERIVTDRGYNLAQEIEALRDKAPLPDRAPRLEGER